jgi:hypothetical protein
MHAVFRLRAAISRGRGSARSCRTHSVRWSPSTLPDGRSTEGGHGDRKPTPRAGLGAGRPNAPGRSGRDELRFLADAACPDTSPPGGSTISTGQRRLAIGSHLPAGRRSDLDGRRPMVSFVPVRLYRRGWPIIAFEDGRWRWAASGRYLRTGPGDDEPCVRCHLRPTLEGYDPCLGVVAGAKAACCGHGVTRGYVLWADGRRDWLPQLDAEGGDGEASEGLRPS